MARSRSRKSKQERKRLARQRARLKRQQVAAAPAPRRGLSSRLWDALRDIAQRRRRRPEAMRRRIRAAFELAERQVEAAEEEVLEAERYRLLLEHRARLTAHRSVLETAMRADPGLVEAYLVYADWLQARGDPYGDLIAVQHRLLATPQDRELQREESRLLKQLGRVYRPWPTWNR